MVVMGVPEWEAEGGAIVEDEDEELLTPGEVARRFHVDPKTVTRWSKAGKITSFRTLGGHRRYKGSEVQKLIEGTQT